MLNNHILSLFDSLTTYVQTLWFPTTPIPEVYQEIFLTAFVHKSYASDFVPALDHNERLEFLWDSILGASIGSLLYKTYPQRSEAQMTLYKIALVREEMLAQVAREINLWDHIILSKGEITQHGSQKDAILSDTLEALIGAWYLIYGFESVAGFITTYLRPHLDTLKATNCKSYKSLIQERSQGKGYGLPTYTTTETQESGEIVFVSLVQIEDKITSEWKGKNKKKAQEDAAYHAYMQTTTTASNQ